MGRDVHRKGVEAKERIRVTDATWQRYFDGRLNLPDMFVNNDQIPRHMGKAPALHEL
jgi:hypothetical protein